MCSCLFHFVAETQDAAANRIPSAAVFVAQPGIAVLAPSGIPLGSSPAGGDLGTADLGSSVTVNLTILNTGTSPLTLGAITADGANAGDFSRNTSALLPTVPPGASTTFAVTFTPTVTGSRGAALQIVSNDRFRTPFTANVSGTGFYSLALQQANFAAGQAAGQNAVLSAPYNFGLFTATQYAANRTAGQNDVLNAPNAFSLYTLSQVQTLNIGVPLLTRDAGNGNFKLTVGVQQSPHLATTPLTPFPINSADVSTTINAQGQLEVGFPGPANAQFFRVQSQ